MLEIGEETYYFDLDAISKYIRIESDDTVSLESEPVDEGSIIIDVPKWEMIKAITECVLTDNSLVDESMGIKGLENGMTVPFKLSFNTLLKYKFLKK